MGGYDSDLGVIDVVWRLWLPVWRRLGYAEFFMKVGSSNRNGHEMLWQIKKEQERNKVSA
jgi:hypothetical protein